MAIASNKDLPQGVSEHHGTFELGLHSVNWYKQNDGWHVVIQVERNAKGGPAMNSMTNHQEPYMAYEEFKRIVKSILTTTSTNEVINIK